MNWKKYLLHGIAAGVLAAVAGIIFLFIYQHSLGVSYEKVINPVAIVASSLFGCMLMAIGYAVLEKSGKERLKGLLNVLIALLSFASIIAPISMSLPLDTPNPDLFPGLAIPMHFFPALSFLAIAPFSKGTK